jgi:hypothetical protein
VLRLGDGAHLHLKKQNKKKNKEKEGEPKLPLYQNLPMVPTCA